MATDGARSLACGRMLVLEPKWLRMAVARSLLLPCPRSYRMVMMAGMMAVMLVTIMLHAYDGYDSVYSLHDAGA